MTSLQTRHVVVPVLIAAVLAGLSAVAAAQGTAADYARAAALKQRYESAAILLSLIHIPEPTRQGAIPYAVFCSKKNIRSSTIADHSQPYSYLI